MLRNLATKIEAQQKKKRMADVFHVKRKSVGEEKVCVKKARVTEPSDKPQESAQEKLNLIIKKHYAKEFNIKDEAIVPKCCDIQDTSAKIHCHLCNASITVRKPDDSTPWQTCNFYKHIRNCKTNQTKGNEDIRKAFDRNPGSALKSGSEKKSSTVKIPRIRTDSMGSENEDDNFNPNLLNVEVQINSSENTASNHDEILPCPSTPSPKKKIRSNQINESDEENF